MLFPKHEQGMIKICCLVLALFFSVQYTYPEAALTTTEIIALLDYIALEAELTREYQADSLLLESIYLRLENDLDPGVMNKDYRDQIKMLFDEITDFSKIDLRRQHIRQLRETAKARAIQQTIPSPVMLLSLTNNLGNPAALVINVLGIAAQSVTGYLNAVEQADLQAYEADLALTEKQKDAVNELRKGLWDFTAIVATNNGLRGNDTVSRRAVEEFASARRETNLSTKTRRLLDQQPAFEKFFPYWLELANTHHAAKRYNECLAAIERYEAIQAPIFRQNGNGDYAETLVRGIDALASVYKNDPAAYTQRCIEYLEKIENNAPDDAWLTRYSAALAWFNLASAANNVNRNSYLIRAFQLLRSNTRSLTVIQREMIAEYEKPLPGKGLFGGLFKKDDPVTAIRRLELPPYHTPLSANSKALFAVMANLTLPVQDKNDITEMLNGALFIPVSRYQYLNGEQYGTNNFTPVRNSAFSAKIHNSSTGRTVGRIAGIAAGAVAVGASVVMGPGVVVVGPGWRRRRRG